MRGQHGARAEKDAGEVHVEHALPQRDVGMRERRGLRLARVVDEDVDGADARLNASATDSSLRDIDADARDVAPCARICRAASSSRSAIAAHQRDARAGAQQRLRDRRADAAAAARDDRMLSRER